MSFYSLSLSHAPSPYIYIYIYIYISLSFHYLSMELLYLFSVFWILHLVIKYRIAKRTCIYWTPLSVQTPLPTADLALHVTIISESEAFVLSTDLTQWKNSRSSHVLYVRQRVHMTSGNRERAEESFIIHKTSEARAWINCSLVQLSKSLSL